jgi:cysteine-rich repeat protein
MSVRRLALALALGLAACGGGGGSSNPPDAGPDAAPFMLCGNFEIEGSEACDDGNEDPDDGCSADCQLECGDGAVTGDEACDTGIETGDGACPTEETCADEDPCTTGVVSGAGCAATCEFATTTAPIDDDECCPAGQDATTDNDCDAVCGNGVVEDPEETCDTAIEAGDPGACPTACDDGELCTTDVLEGGDTCQADCVETPITEIGLDDECCPEGGTPETDPDCLDSCGDGEVEDPETCDIAIAQGDPGACPTACDDGDVCTSDTLVNAGTCFDDCVEAPIPPGADDGCCPAGSDLGDDPDCPPACGDGVITPPETCDDDNTSAGDGCSDECQIEPVAFRFTDLDLRDPHAFASVFGFCIDVTDIEIGDTRGVNPLLQLNIQNDDPEDDDTLLDLSIANTFTPFEQAAGTSPVADLVFPDCTAPMAGTSCTLPEGSTHTTATAANLGSNTVCLGPVSGTTSGYSPPVVSPQAPAGGSCYVATAGTVTFSLGGIPITLEDARIAGEWFGTPATEVRDGMIRGFMSEADADATIIPEGTTGIDSIDGSPLSSLLPGGSGNCEAPSPEEGDLDERDGVPGWYFYLNFSAARVPYLEE